MCRGVFPDRKRGLRRVSGPKTRFPCHDTDRCADSYVSRRVSGPKTRFPSRDTDRIGKWSVSWQAGGKQAFVGCLSRRRLSPKCARRTGHRQRGIRFLLRALAFERPMCAAILRYTASGRSFVRALWRGTQINGQNGGKHRSTDKTAGNTDQQRNRVTDTDEQIIVLTRRQCRGAHLAVASFFSGNCLNRCRDGTVRPFTSSS